ncbi:MAG: general secretion pathway protein L [Halioglobus sp.]|jgi:general secretion pathway protein L
MLETNQSWNLFGYDLRRGVHYFRAGWNDFLWGDQSPVLGAVDEVVKAHEESGDARYFKSGKPVAGSLQSAKITAEAVVLPDSLVLSKLLRIPTAAEAELEAVVGLEVSSSSPFPANDTCYGSLITGRRAQELEVQLVISSQSAVMAHIAAQHESHDVHAFEVWARVVDRIVLLTGFGEAGRQQRNRRRLGRMAGIAAYCLAVVLALFAFAAGWKYLELQKVQTIHDEVAESATDVLELRTQLATAKTLIATANDLLIKYPSPYVELKRLTALLGDETSLLMAEMEGSKIKIEGESADASAVMQQLLNNPSYARVEAPIAFKKVRSGMERFVLVLTLNTGGKQ